MPHCQGSAGDGCPRLAPLCFPQLHIVHINIKYRTLAEAKGHPNGLAVLGFFFQVGHAAGGMGPPGSRRHAARLGSPVRLPPGSKKGQEGWVKARRCWGTSVVKGVVTPSPASCKELLTRSSPIPTAALRQWGAGAGSACGCSVVQDGPALPCPSRLLSRSTGLRNP